MTHFSLHIKVLAISVTFGLGSIVVALASQAASYTVTISSESPRAAVVEAQFRPDDGVIWMNDDGDQGLPHGWSTFVRGLEVRGPEGKPIDVVYEPLSRWRLEGTETGPLSVRYEVLLQHDRFPLNFGDNGAAYIRDGAVMWSGRALFLAGQEAQDIELQLNLPAEWKATTPWERVAGVPNRFEVVDTDDLVNSAFMVGSHLERVVRQGPLELRLALSGPEVASAEEIFASELAKYLQYYDSTIGPAPRRSMIVIAADSSYWGGEVMGRAISLSVTDEITGPNPMLAHLFAHETAHLWGLDINFAEDDKEELYWFYEGMLAEYLSYTANTRLGDISEDDLKAQLDEHYSKYKAAAEPGLSMSTVGHEKAAHYDLI
jgi:predicted metalloprotease with PDZ domain